MSEVFQEFPKIHRLSREIIVTEKIDGTNASVFIGEDGSFLCGSRTRWITPEDDNYGFARWAHENKMDLLQLGAGHHFGEWWGGGIQRRYGLTTKKFSLFNVSRWEDPSTRPHCVDVVPVLYRGVFDTKAIDEVLVNLKERGSKAAPGFMAPEGVVVFHVPSGAIFKKTLDKNDGHKGTEL